MVAEFHQTFWMAVHAAVRSPSRLDEDIQLTVFTEDATTPAFFLLLAGERTFVSEKLLGYEPATELSYIPSSISISRPFAMITMTSPALETHPFHF